MALSTKEYTISNEIYPDFIIKNAVEVFSGISDVVYKNGVITIKDEDSEKVFLELMNYAIGLINE